MQTDALKNFVLPGMASVEAGWFTMGCATGRDDEKPEHRVWVDAFEIATHQLTNAEYAPFLLGTKRSEPQHWMDAEFSHPRQPVAAVSWYDANTYCAWLSLITGHHYRLPTEAEWEFAARGGIEGALYPWGDAPPEEIPNYAARWKTAPEEVGLCAPNPFGIYNLGDNVHEWCADWYDADYYARSPERNPRGPESGIRKASRGGSWELVPPLVET